MSPEEAVTVTRSGGRVKERSTSPEPALAFTFGADRPRPVILPEPESRSSTPETRSTETSPDPVDKVSFPPTLAAFTLPEPDEALTVWTGGTVTVSSALHIPSQG